VTADLQAQVDERRTQRARDLLSLKVDGDVCMTAARRLHYLTPMDAGKVVLHEVDRRIGLGMDPVQAQRSVISDLHDGRWMPTGSVDGQAPVVDLLDPTTCTHPVADMGHERLGCWICVSCGLVYPVPCDGPDEPTEPWGL
jgi:hypothetical protein